MLNMASKRAGVSEIVISSLDMYRAEKQCQSIRTVINSIS